MTFSVSKPWPTSIAFQGDDGRTVFTIGPGGTLAAGDGLSDDEATRAMFATMCRVYPELMRELAGATPTSSGA